ncbi:hypothetical protein TSOC_004014, partial [Tetrabaena socialis]
AGRLRPPRPSSGCAPPSPPSTSRWTGSAGCHCRCPCSTPWAMWTRRTWTRSCASALATRGPSSSQREGKRDADLDPLECALSGASTSGTIHERAH